MAMNKKGMFFTVLVLLLITLFFVSYTLYDYIQNEKSSRKRVQSLDNFLVSAREDLRRQLYIGGFRTIFLIQDRIVQTGQYATQVDQLFQSALINGTLFNQSQTLLIGTTLAEIEQNIGEKAGKINANLTISNPVINVSQQDPWNVQISLTANIYLSDISGKEASWNSTEAVIALIPVTSFEDPIYLVNTGGLLSNKITKTPYSIFVQGSNVQNLLQHASSSYYKASQTAPNFLQRLQGNLTADVNGIESMVNLNDLSLKGMPAQDKSAIDYIYFSSQNPLAYHIQGMPSWFRLDQPHLQPYQTENITLP